VQQIVPGMPVLGARLAPRRLRTADGAADLEALAGQRVLAVAGVARPAPFIALLEELGAEVVASRCFADHHAYRAAEVEALLGEARAESAVVITTAKDAVKLDADAPVWVLEVEMVPLDGWDRLWRLLPEL
jgi:tetraacyldisaccharide 4'-kinase